MNGRFKRNLVDGSLEVNLSLLEERGPKRTNFLDEPHSCEHVVGGLCGKCLANIRAESFQTGYAVGYQDGRGERQ